MGILLLLLAAYIEFKLRRLSPSGGPARSAVVLPPHATAVGRALIRGDA